ncbi:Nitrilase family, member 2 [Seminavis robusta]|uniref:Nitrilase family, member 2 n=1 Tax=Seminavis robusta TaxID=568900 RepID=A0A9N8DI49_9STRA|nr:Nitrilase family, member 2 [Seminavis robusta]|eukprot:Sro97_g049840.1 Nitrilase family, member 2 (280) ;mRNA; r:18515-19729
MCTNFNLNPTAQEVRSHFNEVDTSGMIPLSITFQPTDNDVICARGKEVYNHEGNRRFRELVKSNLHTYSKCVTKMQKTRLVASIIETVRAKSGNGGFVKFIKGKWYEVGDRRAKEKTGQTMRDLLHTRYTSSTKAKARVRRQLREDRDLRMLFHPVPPSSLPVRSVIGDQMPRRQMDTEQQYYPFNEALMVSPSEGRLDPTTGTDHPVTPAYNFSMADKIFGLEEGSKRSTFDLSPLPLEDSIVDLDFDTNVADVSVSDESFGAAMDCLFQSLLSSTEK